MSEPISMSAADLTSDDVESVLDVLRSGRLALGPKCEAFEAAVAEFVGVPHAVAVNSGTAALHLAVKALGIGPGDEVLVPSFTFAASVNAFLYEGARPVFVDIEAETFNLDPADLERKIGPRTRAIMAVDVFGHPAPWAEIERIAAAHGLRVIDDACEALGAEYRGRRIGGMGEAATFAFYPNKQMTTGEGGILVTADERVAQLCRSLRNQGRGSMGTWLEHERLGYNYRMDEMSAALGLSQIGRIEVLLEKRARVAAGYTERLRDIGWLRTPVVRADVRMSWFVYVVLLEEGMDRDPFMAAMEAQGIPVRGYFSPVHRQPYVREHLDGAPPALPVTDSVARRTVALPFHGNLTEEEMDRVVDAIRSAGEACLASAGTVRL